MLPKGFSLAIVPCVVFSEKEIKEAPPEALELGCDPDYSGYTMKLNTFPQLPNPAMRSAGGHVHIGWGTGFDRLSTEFIQYCSALAVELDYYIGAPSLAWDSDSTRRKIYGAAGAFRPKSYGMEYRSLSNQWLLSDELIGFVFDNTINAICSLIRNPVLTSPLSFFGGAARTTSKDIINSGEVMLGQALFQKLRKTSYV